MDHSTNCGIGEPLVSPVSYVTEGTPVGRIQDFDRLDEDGVEATAHNDDFVKNRRFRSNTNQGDIVIGIAAEVERQSTIHQNTEALPYREITTRSGGGSG